MKNFVLFSVLNVCLVINLMAQNSVKKQNLPQEKSKVTREYDDKGNLIRFDSVYTYSYSSDSTLNKNLLPKDLPKFFGHGFSFPNDSTFNGKSFFDEFDKAFANPFGRFDEKQDSIPGKHQFHPFYDNDSTTFSLRNLDDMFGNFFEGRKDSASVKKPGQTEPHLFKPKSMEEMMQMFENQILEMENRQKEFFGNKKLKDI